jgi:hypothetical protein
VVKFKLPGAAFTLWLDPARWPAAKFKLPGAGFTLWQDPARWPVVKFKLPGRAHTVWLDPARWPVPLKRLPGAGFSLWLNPESWPKSRLMEQPVVADVKTAAPPPTPGVAEPIAALPEVPSPAPMPISLPHNKAFTLWTRPSHVSPIPMKNGLTAAQLAAESNPAPVPQAALSTVPAPIVQPALQPAKMVHSPAERWLPLAAALAAILGINSMIKVTDTKVSQAMQSDLATNRASVEAVNKKLKDIGTAHALDLKTRDAKLAELQALNTALKQQKDLLITDLAKAQESLKQVEATQKEQDTRLVQMTKELEQAKAVAAGADSKAQSLVQSAQEEAAKIKRESGAALVALQASQAKLEAEKAAAVKAAADAAAALAALQAKWDALPKATP